MLIRASRVEPRILRPLHCISSVRDFLVRRDAQRIRCLRNVRSAQRAGENLSCSIVHGRGRKDAA